MSQPICFDEEEKKRGVAFTFGLLNSYLHKFSFEDRDHMSNSEFYRHFGIVDGIPNEPPNTHDFAMKFLKQVRETNGYGVDCRPIDAMDSPFAVVDLDKLKRTPLNDVVELALNFAIDTINFETENNYKLVRIDNVVPTIMALILLTFTVKDESQVVGDSTQLITLRAMVGMPFGTREDVKTYVLYEWMSVQPPEEYLSSSSDGIKEKEDKN